MIKMELAACESAGTPGIRQRSPSPFFAINQASTNGTGEVGKRDEISYDEATSQHLEKSGVPSWGELEQKFR